MVGCWIFFVMGELLVMDVGRGFGVEGSGSRLSSEAGNTDLGRFWGTPVS